MPTISQTIRKTLITMSLAIVVLGGCRSGFMADQSERPMHDALIEDLLKISNDNSGAPNKPAKMGDDHKSSIDERPDSYENPETEFNAGIKSGVLSFADDRGFEVKQVAFIDDGVQVKPLSLDEAKRMAIENSEFITDTASFLSPNNRLLEDPQFLQSRYDLDMQKSSSQGVEAALAEFDPQIATGFQWGQNSILQASSNLLSSDLLVNNNGNFYGRFDKPIRSGGTASVIHNLNYAGSSQSFTLDPRYTGYLRGEFRQPLLAGRGEAVTRIAGHNSYRARQPRNGLAVAEIAEQSAELEFEMGVERLLKQTEELYWDYWLASQVFEAQRTAVENANEIASRIRNRASSGLTGGGAAETAQAEENYHRRKSLADAAQVEREQAAERLQHVTGLAVEPETFLLTVTDPLDAPIVFDLESSLSNGLNNRKELIKQDLQLQIIEYQLLAAKQFNRPKLDLVSGVQFNGLGDQLLGSENGALPSFVDTDDVGWNVGFEFSMSPKFNRERLNVRYLRLLLTKARTARMLQEKEILHEISFTAKSVDKWTQSLDSARQRHAASERRLTAVQADFEAGRLPLDQLLRSQDSVAEARSEVSRSIAELTKAQLEFLFRQGLR